LKVGSVVPCWFKAHRFELQSHKLCGDFMSACSRPAALEQVVGKETHIRANRFWPNGGRGLVGSILTGQNYARCP
jgi:hypothetical protein